MKVIIFSGASTSCKASAVSYLAPSQVGKCRNGRTSAKSESPSLASSLSCRLRGFGCSVMLTSFGSSKNGSDFLFLVCRRTLCDADVSWPDDRAASGESLISEATQSDGLHEHCSECE